MLLKSLSSNPRLGEVPNMSKEAATAMIDELRQLRELTETLTGNGYLRDQTNEWEYALDAIPDCIYIINTKLEIKFVNKVLAERLHKKKEDLYGLPCGVAIMGGVCCSFEDKDPDGLDVVKEVYLGNLDGWFDITRSPIYTKTDKLIGFICVLQDVTARKEAADNLFNREATLESIFNAAPIGVGLLKREGRIILSCNKFLLDLVGYSEEELVGSSARMLYSCRKEFDRVARVKHAEIAKTGIGAIETKFKTKHGKIIDVLLRSSVIKEDNEKLVFTVTDITLRKQREKKLKLNEERLESVLELSKMDQHSEEEIMDYALEEAVRLTSSKIGYLHFVDSGKDITDAGVNLHLFKWSKGVHDNCDAKKVTHYPLERAGCWADCVRQKKPIIHNDYSYLTEEDGKRGLPDGHINLVRHLSVPIFEGDAIVAVAGVGNKEELYDKTDLRQLNLFMNSMWDIVKRKRAEDLANIFKEELLVAMEQSHAGVAIADAPDGKLRYVNRSGIDIRGFSEEELTNITVESYAKNWQIYHLDGTLYKPEDVPLARAMTKGELVVEIFIIKRSDGEERRVLAHAAPIFNKNKEIVSGIVVFLDITEASDKANIIENSEKKFKAVFDTNADVIVIIHLEDGVMVDVNPAFESLSGFTREESVGKSILDLNIWVNLNDREKFYEELLRNKKVTNMETILRHKDGNEVLCVVSSSVVLIDSKPHAVSIIRKAS